MVNIIAESISNGYRLGNLVTPYLYVSCAACNSCFCRIKLLIGSCNLKTFQFTVARCKSVGSIVKCNNGFIAGIFYLCHHRSGRWEFMETVCFGQCEISQSKSYYVFLRRMNAELVADIYCRNHSGVGNSLQCFHLCFLQ